MYLGNYAYLSLILCSHLVSNSDGGKTRSQSLSKHVRRVKSKRTIPEQPRTASQVIGSVLKDYDKNSPPSQDRPTEVKIGIYVSSFHSVSEMNMDYEVSIYLRQAWTDHRLAHAKLDSTMTPIRLSETQISKVWLPDTYFHNEKFADFHGITVPNKMLKLKPSGEVWYVTKISAKLQCKMTLHNYPMDTQRCPIMFESFGYTMSSMYFNWLNTPVDMDDTLRLPQYSFMKPPNKYELTDCSKDWGAAGAFTCLEIAFMLSRDLGFYLIQVYVPSILIVILSWVSFWINVDASPARVTIGLLTVLTTTTAMAGRNATLPKVSYIKAMDVWIMMCLVFVFLSLIEYAIVNTLAPRQGNRPPKSQPMRRLTQQDVPDRYNRGTPLHPLRNERESRFWNCLQRTSTSASSYGVNRGMQQAPLQPPPAPAAPNMPKAPERDGKFQARRVDKVARKCFPSAFLVFNLVYWSYYMLTSGKIFRFT